jgi:hypothetical protein
MTYISSEVLESSSLLYLMSDHPDRGGGGVTNYTDLNPADILRGC